MSKNRISRADIARMACVSEATVSLALNGNLRVKLATRERISRLAQEVGYIPDRAARALNRAGSSDKIAFDHIGFVVFGKSDLLLNESYLLMLVGAEKAATDLRAQLVFARVDLDQDPSRATILSQENVDGWLVIGELNDRALKSVRSWDRPFVVLGDKQSDIPAHQVYIDHEQAGRIAVEYLVGKGHHRIAILNGPLGFLYQRQIMKGYRDALTELTGTVDERLVFLLEKEDHIVEKVKSAFSLPQPPTALIQAECFAMSEQTSDIFQQVRPHIQDPSCLPLIGLESQTHRIRNHPTITTVGPSLGETGVKLLVDVGSEKNRGEHVLKISPILNIR